MAGWEPHAEWLLRGGLASLPLADAHRAGLAAAIAAGRDAARAEVAAAIEAHLGPRDAAAPTADQGRAIAAAARAAWESLPSAERAGARLVAERAATAADAGRGEEVRRLARLLARGALGSEALRSALATPRAPAADDCVVPVATGAARPTDGGSDAAGGATRAAQGRGDAGGAAKGRGQDGRGGAGGSGSGSGSGAFAILGGEAPPVEGSSAPGATSAPLSTSSGPGGGGGEGGPGAGASQGGGQDGRGGAGAGAGRHEVGEGRGATAGGPTPPGRAPRRDSSRRRTASQVRAALLDEPPRARSARRSATLLAASLAALVVALSALAIVSSRGAPPAPAPPPATPPAPRPEVGARVLRLLAEARSLAGEGRLDEAVDVLESFPPAQRTDAAWTAAGEPELRRCRELLALQLELDDGLAAARRGDAAALLALVRRVEDPGFPLRGEPALAALRERARALLGADRYAGAARGEAVDLTDLLARGGGGGGGGGPPARGGPALDLPRRGDDARHARLLAAAAPAVERLAAARERLAAARAARAARVEADGERARRGTEATPIEHDGARWRVVAYDEDGFSVETDGRRADHGWLNAPAELAYEVRRRATDPADAQAVLALGLFALRRLAAPDDPLLARAQEHLARAVALDPALRALVPDVGEVVARARLFRGQVVRATGAPEIAVRWLFEQHAEAMDFEGLGPLALVEVADGCLRVRSPAPLPYALARVRGEWEPGSLTVHAALATAPALVGLVSNEAFVAVRASDRGLALLDLTDPEAPPLASGEGAAAPGAIVRLAARAPGPGRLEVSARVGDGPELRHEVPWPDDARAGAPVAVVVGACDDGTGRAAARLAGLSVGGTLSARWERRARAGIPNAVARALLDVERAASPDAWGLPVSLGPTSAEDEVGLLGIPPAAQELVAQGRALAARGLYGEAEERFREAADAHLEYHAATYLAGVLRAWRDPDGALLAAERALAGIDDFHEAHTLRARALLALGRRGEAREAIGAALRLRPDHAPAYEAQANLEVLEGRYEDALHTLELALELAPGDTFTAWTAVKARALAEGPAWSRRERAVTPSYVLETDLVGEGARLGAQLEAVRARFVEAFPDLAPGGAPERKASVLVFSEPEGYYAYSEATVDDRSESTLGHFNPWSGQLLLFLEDGLDAPDALHVLFHEGFHQWVHAHGVALPFWANEGIAEYLAGTRLAPDGRIEARGVVDAFLRGRLEALAGAWPARQDFLSIMGESPDEFYSGDVGLKYAQAWAMVHFFMQGGDEAARGAFRRYLERLRALGGARGGARLEYAYVDTFHQLDVRALEGRFGAWVARLAAEHGVAWRHGDAPPRGR